MAGKSLGNGEHVGSQWETPFGKWSTNSGFYPHVCLFTDVTGGYIYIYVLYIYISRVDKIGISWEYMGLDT